jgi:EmrB/QacA subfamily drug resistance transporter
MSAVGVALPAIGRDLNASAVQLSLTITTLVLADAMFLLPVGRFADIYGRKKIFITGTIILGIATLALGLINSISIFLLLRFFQGVGSAMILVTSVAILTAVFPPQRRGRALGITVAMVYVGLSLGPTLSGLIVNYLGWRWVFFVSFGCIVAALLLTLFRLKGEWTVAADEPFDYIGAGVFMVSLCLFVLGAARSTESLAAKWILASGIIGLVVFAIMEWRASYPLIDLRMLLSNLGFSFSNLATFLNYASASSFVFLFSLYLQYVKGLSPKQAGMLLIVQPAIQALLAPLTGRLSDTYPPSIIATIGMGLCTIGLLASAFIAADTSIVYIVLVMVLLGVSLGLFSSSNMTAIMNSVGSKYQGTASSMVATMRVMGMLCSATAIAVILSIYLGDAAVTPETVPGFVTSMQTGLWMFSVLSFFGTIFSMVKGRLAVGIGKDLPV